MLKNLKTKIFGEDFDLNHPMVLRRISLIAFFAWIGLGADGLSSSCYGPAEIFKAIGEYHFLGIIIGLMTVATIFIISISYMQIIELFPNGGGGYFVAGELLAPKLGMVSGCALIIDYALTISLSVASGVDALLSLAPAFLISYKVEIAVFIIFILTVMNLRGAKESIKKLLPVFMLFIVTHAVILTYAIYSHMRDATAVISKVSTDISVAHTSLGTAGLIFILLKGYSLGAGTYTGLEAVSNGVPILKEPRVETAKRTMLYMALSLSITVMGLLLAYVLYGIVSVDGETLNATLFYKIVENWGETGRLFAYITLLSEAFLLFIAAQTGFLDGPRVMANMALDKWFPERFILLSDRLVMQNGTLCMSLAAGIILIIFKGSVSHLVILYSINVFITFVLSQAGMVRLWWLVRGVGGQWFRKFCVNGVGLFLTTFILISVIVVKFEEGGWVTIIVTVLLVSLCLVINSHYTSIEKKAEGLSYLVEYVEKHGIPKNTHKGGSNKNHPTAVVILNGYNGVGLSTLLTILETYENYFKNFLFVEIEVANADIFKHRTKLDKLHVKLEDETHKYVNLMKASGYDAEGLWKLGTDISKEVMEILPEIVEKYPKSVFFGGRIIFKNENIFTKFLHNYWNVSLQRKIFDLGHQFVSIPVSLQGLKVFKHFYNK